jgi:hypothetical protein
VGNTKRNIYTVHAGGGFVEFSEGLENTRSTNADKAGFMHYLQVLQLG